MKNKFFIAMAVIALILPITSNAAQLPDEKYLHEESLVTEADFDPQRLKVAQMGPAMISLLLSQATTLEERFNKEIEALSREYAKQNMELQQLKENRLSAADDHKIREKQSTVQNIEQQQMFRIRELKNFLDYLEELRYQLNRIFENIQIKA